MTNRRVHVEQLLEQMDRQKVPSDPAERHAEQRLRVSGAVDDRLEALAAAQVRHARNRLRVAWAAAAVCFGGALAVPAVLNATRVRRAAHDAVATLQSDAPVDIVRAGQNSRVRAKAGDPLEAADELFTPDEAPARVLLANGAEVDVRAATAIRFDARKRVAEGTVEELRLSRGGVSLSVPKLGVGRTLAVRTPDAIVTVRGTKFGVVVHDDEPRWTSVFVTEGSVWVSSHGEELVLRPGAEWSSPHESAASNDAHPQPIEIGATGPVPSSPSADSPAAGRAAPLGTASLNDPRVRTPGTDETSTLGAENEEYHRAMSAARGGDDARAATRLDEFLAHFPKAPLAQNAKVERFRALRRLGRTQEAARAARQYLTEYPVGFARDEAKALAVESLGGSGP